MKGEIGDRSQRRSNIIDYAQPIDPVSRLDSRLLLLIAGLLLYFGTIFYLAGPYTMLVLSVVLVDGIIALAWIAGATALGAVVLSRFKININPFVFVATAGGLGLGIFSLLGLGLGLAGLLNRAVAIAFPVLSIAAWVIQTRGHGLTLKGAAIVQWLEQPAGKAWLWLVPVVSLAVASASASEMPGILWKPLDPHPYDVTGYHLLVPREWYEGHRIVPLEHNVYSYFQFNVEMQFLLLMHAMGGPWAAMYACQFVCVGYSGLMILAVAGASSSDGKEEATNSNSSSLRVGIRHSAGQSNDHAGLTKANNQQSTGNKEPPNPRTQNLKSKSDDLPDGSASFALPVLGAAVASVVPWVLMLAGVAYVESALMLYTALSVAWALYAIRRRTSFTRALLLSGVMAGLACGVKITAVPMLLLAVPVAVFIVLAVRRPIDLSFRRLWMGCAALLIVGAVIVSPWLIRNFAWAHNPLFPVAMQALGRDHFDAIQVQRFHDAHSPTALQQTLQSKLRLLWRDVLTHWQFGFVLFPAAIIACFVRWRDRQIWALVFCGAFVLTIWIGFTHLLPRFLVMMVPIAAIAIGRLRWGRAWPAGLVMLLGGAMLGWGTVMPELRMQLSTKPLIGLEDLSGLLSPELIDARDRHLQVGMIGDAQAFLYQIPLNQMHYRAVFNLRTGTANPVLTWLGPEAIGHPDWLLVINPNEIERLHETYKGVPALPREWAKRGPDTFFVRGDDPLVLKQGSETSDTQAH